MLFRAVTYSEEVDARRKTFEKYNVDLIVSVNPAEKIYSMTMYVDNDVRYSRADNGEHAVWLKQPPTAETF